MIAAAALAAAAVAGCGGGNHASSVAGGSDGATLPAPAKAASTAEPTRVSTQATPAKPKRAPPTAAQLLTRALGHEFRHAGRASGGAVFDITKGITLFSARATAKRPPASIEKLFTTVAALTELGPDARFHTEVRGTGELGADGIWHGNLYLRGDGDPTFGSAAFNHTWELGYGSNPDPLIAELRHDGIRHVDGEVIGDPSLFDDRRGPPSSDFEPDLPDMGGELSGLTFDHGASSKLTPGAFAASKFAVALRKAHVFALATPVTERTPRAARLLASVSSPPLSTIVRLMDVPSDDFYAETLTKDLGARFAGRGSTAAGAHVVSDAIESGYDLHPQIVDGSGLSRSDGSSPLEIVDFLRAVDDTPVGDRLAAALPTVGIDGTVRTIATQTAAAGRCVAKTGTLDNVTNLAGYCHARGHQLLAFALFLDGPPNWVALPLIGQMVAAVAAY